MLAQSNTETICLIFSQIQNTMTIKTYATEMDKNYNYTRKKLQLPEYGRHIQEMVDSLLSIEDRAERNRQAHAVIAVMGNLNPLLRDTADYTHKLWDHLFIISDFQLDVDSPYPLPTREELNIKPEKLGYTQHRVKMKHYGRYIPKMIREVAKESSQELSHEAMNNIARYMRTKSFEYNQEHPNNELIIKDIRQLADSEIEIDETSINNIRSEYKSAYTQHQQKGAKNQRNAKNQQQRNGGKQKNNHQNRNFQKNNQQRRSVNR